MTVAASPACHLPTMRSLNRGHQGRAVSWFMDLMLKNIDPVTAFKIQMFQGKPEDAVKNFGLQMKDLK